MSFLPRVWALFRKSRFLHFITCNPTIFLWSKAKHIWTDKFERIWDNLQDKPPESVNPTNNHLTRPSFSTYNDGSWSILEDHFLPYHCCNIVNDRFIAIFPTTILQQSLTLREHCEWFIHYRQLALNWDGVERLVNNIMNKKREGNVLFFTSFN